MNRKQIIQLVKSYIRKIETAGIPVKKAYIFGSSVKGNFQKESDIDTCIVSPRFGKDRQKERILLMNLRQEVSDLIEPHPFSLKDFESKYNPFVQEIKNNGLSVSGF